MTDPLHDYVKLSSGTSLMMMTRKHQNKFPLQAVFLGSKSLGLAVLKSLIGLRDDVVWSIIHPNDSIDERSATREWQKYADENGLRFFISNAKRETHELLRSIKPEIALVCGWYQLLDQKSLSLFPKGAWGIHNSLLPKYRGGSPLVWSIMNGDSIVGSTLFKLESEMDSGPILHQIEIRNELNDDVGTILQKIQLKLAREIPTKWLELLNGTARLLIQDETNATYCGQRQENDGNIPWSSTALEVHNFIRAQSYPYPGAFTYFGDKKIRIMSASPQATKWFGTPGQVLSVGNERSGVLIAAGQCSALEIQTIEIDGIPQDARDLLCSLRFRLTETPQPRTP